jgi:hypothetical protein
VCVPGKDAPTLETTRVNKAGIGMGIALGALALVQTTGCGGIYGGGGGGPKATVMGNVIAVHPGRFGRDLVVFVYRLKEQVPDCTTPELPDDNSPYWSETLKDGATTFDLNKVKAGRYVIAILLDNEGKDADGRIDPGDPVAVLNDPACLLDDVPNKYIVEAVDVRVNFGLDDEDGFPEPGRAEADLLKEFPKP